MADLGSKFMGVELKNPLVVGACPLSGSVEKIREIEAAGAGALVIKSLFEEQILHEMGALEDTLEVGAERFAEAVKFFPRLTHSGAREHLLWIEKARAAVKLPLFGSLNAVSPGKWVEYARQLAQTGIDGLELNVYAVEADLRRSARDAEDQLLRTFESVRAAVELPIAVKISPFYTSIGNVVKSIEERGADAVVLFNRFLQPLVDARSESIRNQMTLSHPAEIRLPLRWIALLFGRVRLDLAGSTGVSDAEDVVRYLLAGATVVQAVSVFYRDGIGKIAQILKGLSDWMDGKGYERIPDFIGKVSQEFFKGDPFVFERAQYVDCLMAGAK